MISTVSGGRLGLLTSTTIPAVLESSLDVRKNLKLAPCFYGPYKKFQKIDQVACRLELYFMCLSLRNKLGTRVVVQATLPPLDIMDNSLVPTPQAISDHRNKKNQQEILVHWQGFVPS